MKYLYSFPEVPAGKQTPIDKIIGRWLHECVEGEGERETREDGKTHAPAGRCGHVELFRSFNLVPQMYASIGEAHLVFSISL